MFTGRDTWFALYAIDDKIDDEVKCDQIKRGLFRLHPKGPSGRSEGCIVIDSQADFLTIRTKLHNTTAEFLPNKEIKTYGKVIVR